MFCFECKKMNEIVNKFLLAGDKFIPGMHLKEPGFTYSACGPFTKNKERIKKFMQTGNTDFIYRNELDKACFQHDMAYGKSKDLARRTESDKVLRDKAFKIAHDPKYDGYQRGLNGLQFFLIKRVLVEQLKPSQIINLQMNFTSRSLENLRNEKSIHLLKTKLGVLI